MCGDVLAISLALVKFSKHWFYSRQQPRLDPQHDIIPSLLLEQLGAINKPVWTRPEVQLDRDVVRNVKQSIFAKRGFFCSNAGIR